MVSLGNYLMFVTSYLMLIACYLMLVPCYLMLVASCLMFVTTYMLLSSACLIFSYLWLIHSPCLMRLLAIWENDDTSLPVWLPTWGDVSRIGRGVQRADCCVSPRRPITFSAETDNGLRADHVFLSRFADALCLIFNVLCLFPNALRRFSSILYQS